MVIGFEPGLQAYTGVSGGVEHEKSIISYLNGKVARGVQMSRQSAVSV